METQGGLKKPESQTSTTGALFSSDELPSMARKRERVANDAALERAVFRYTTRDLMGRLFKGVMPLLVAKNWYSFSRTLRLGATSTVRLMAESVGFVNYVMAYHAGSETDSPQAGLGFDEAMAVKLPRLSEPYPGLSEELKHAQASLMLHNETHDTAELDPECGKDVARWHRRQTRQAFLMYSGLVQQTLDRVYEEGCVAPAAKKVYVTFTELAKGARSIQALRVLWDSFEEFYRETDFLDNGRRGFNVRSVFKNANRAEAHARDRAEREAQVTPAAPLPEVTAGAHALDGYGADWTRMSGEEKSRRDAEAAEAMARMLASLNRSEAGSDAVGRCQIRDERLAEYFVVEFHPGYQVINLLVDSHEARQGVSHLDTWVKELRCSNPQKVLPRILRHRLAQAAETGEPIVVV